MYLSSACVIPKGCIAYLEVNLWAQSKAIMSHNARPPWSVRPESKRAVQTKNARGRKKYVT